MQVIDFRVSHSVPILILERKAIQFNTILMRKLKGLLKQLQKHFLRRIIETWTKSQHKKNIYEGIEMLEHRQNLLPA